MKIFLIPKKLIRFLHHLYLIVDTLYFPGRYEAVVESMNAGSISHDCVGHIESSRLGGDAENFVLQTNRKDGCKTIHDRGFGKARGAEYVHHRASGLYQGQL